MYGYISFLQEGAFEQLFSGWKPWVLIPILIVGLYVLFARSRKIEGVE